MTTKKFKEFISLPEMRVSWIFLGLAVPLAFVDFYYLERSFAWVNFSVIFFLGGVIFWRGAKLAGKNADIALQYRRLNSIVANLRDGVIGYDENFRITGFNRAAEEILGLKKEEAIGAVVAPQLTADPKWKVLTQIFFPSLAPTIKRKSEPGVFPQVIDIAFSEPRLEFRVSTDRLADERGRILGFVKVVRDRTREVELLESKSEFITVAAHQLRTPLTAVNWALEGLKSSESLANTEEKELVSTGLAAASKLLKIVNDLLDAAKIEEGRFGYSFADLEMTTFLEGLLNDHSVIAKEYQVSLYFDRPTESIILYADKNRLYTALSNLLNNAIKYNVPNGEARVKLERLTDKPYALLTMKDTGMGIDAEGLKKLFTKFYRGENVVRKETEGSGLGLYITKNIILRHGGTISAESELNRGTTFYIELPTDPRLVPPKETAFEEA